MAKIVLRVANGVVGAQSVDEDEILRRLINPTCRVEGYLKRAVADLLPMEVKGRSFPRRPWTREWEKITRQCYTIHDGKVRSAVLYVASDSGELTCLIKNSADLITPIYPEDGDEVFTTYAEAYGVFEVTASPEAEAATDELLEMDWETWMKKIEQNEEDKPLQFYKNWHLYMLYRNHKWGLINEREREVLPCAYDSFEPMPECDYTEVRRGDCVGCIDSDGVIRVPVVYGQIVPFAEGATTYAEKDGLWGIIDKDGSIVAPFDMDYLRIVRLNKDYVTTQDCNFKWGVMDGYGQVVVPCVYDEEIHVCDLPQLCDA